MAAGKYERTSRRNTYRPALHKLPGGFSGFSQNPVMSPESSISTTPQADGLADRNSATDAMRSCPAWKSINSASEKVVRLSAYTTKKDSSPSTKFQLEAIVPALPSKSGS